MGHVSATPADGKALLALTDRDAEALLNSTSIADQPNKIDILVHFFERLAMLRMQQNVMPPVEPEQQSLSTREKFANSFRRLIQSGSGSSEPSSPKPSSRPSSPPLAPSSGPTSPPSTVGSPKLNEASPLSQQTNASSGQHDNKPKRRPPSRPPPTAPPPGVLSAPPTTPPPRPPPQS